MIIFKVVPSIVGIVIFVAMLAITWPMQKAGVQSLLSQSKAAQQTTIQTEAQTESESQSIEETIAEYQAIISSFYGTGN